MKKKLILLACYAVLTPFLLLSLILLSLYYSYSNSNHLNKTVELLKKNVYFKALPETNSETLVNVEAKDARGDVLRDFFTKYKSPLLPHSNTIIETADKYGIDYRLIPAIAMQESNLCKKIPKDSHNCWGFGIYGGKVTKFSNYDEAIETVTRTLARDYKQKGLENPEDIMKKYTPSSNGSWANGVNYFMEMINTNL